MPHFYDEPETIYPWTPAREKAKPPTREELTAIKAAVAALADEEELDEAAWIRAHMAKADRYQEALARAQAGDQRAVAAVKAMRQNAGKWRGGPMAVK